MHLNLLDDLEKKSAPPIRKPEQYKMHVGLRTAQQIRYYLNLVLSLREPHKSSSESWTQDTLVKLFWPRGTTLHLNRMSLLSIIYVLDQSGMAWPTANFNFNLPQCNRYRIKKFCLRKFCPNRFICSIVPLSVPIHLPFQIHPPLPSGTSVPDACTSKLKHLPICQPARRNR